MDSRAGFVTVDGTRLELRHIPGDTARAPLLFLHEGLGCVGLWTQRGRDWPAALCAASGRAGWVWSRRGYGRSDPIADVRGAGRHPPTYMHHEARVVLPHLLAVLGVTRPLLVGHSDGATIALLHAAAFEVAGCIAMAPHVFVEAVALAAITAARDAYQEGGLRERLARHHADVDSAFWQWNDVWLSDAFRAFDIRRDCAAINAPLLLVQGRDDEYGTLAQIDAITQQVPHAQALVLEDCGHSPHRDRFDELTAAAARFLATTG